MNLARSSLRQLALCGLGVALLASSSAQAQTNAAAPLPPVLTNVAQVIALGPARGKQLKHPVALHGTVTYVNSRRQFFILEDATGALTVQTPATNFFANFQEDAEVRGFTGFESGNIALVGVFPERVVIHGRGVLPTPRVLTLTEAGAAKADGHWSQVEGIVVEWRRVVGNALRLHLADLSGDTWIGTVAVPDSEIVRNLVGSRVRAAGLNVVPGATALLLPEPQIFTILSRGNGDPFAAPETTVTALRAQPPSGERVRLRGTLLHLSRSLAPTPLAFVRTPTGTLQALLLPTQGAEGTTDLQSSASVPIPAARSGDVVEIVGSHTVNQPNLALRSAQMRVLENGPEPEPIPASLAEVAAGGFVSDYVVLRGRLINRHEMAISPSIRRDSLLLSADGHDLKVIYDVNASGQSAPLRLDDLIEARGLVVPDGATSAGQAAKKILMLAGSAANVRSLGLAPEVVRMQTLRLIGAGAGFALLTGGWIALLRMRLAQARRIAAAHERADAAIREANASLEHRVTERTAELEKAREELRRTLLAEKELGELKTRFVSLVSHEFRTPLGITMSAVELLRNYLDKLPPEKLRELLNDIYSSTLRMSGLMEQVLVLGRVEAGRVGFKPDVVELGVLGGKLTDETLSATNHRCPVTFTVENSLAGAEGDEALLRHIFSNLLGNAVKYSPAGRPVEFRARRDGDDGVFIVRDRGIGIPPADQARLFEAFHRGANVGDTPGTGLGMMIVKRCVELHHGAIAFESAPDTGTTFTVRLPLFNEGNGAP